jgi:hypothetical protein
MGNFDNIFSDKNKVALSHDGEIFKFKDWTVGCLFAGVYIGNHIWQGDDGPVVAHDFAKCEIDSEKQDENKVFTINEFAALKKIAENITPGQIVGLRYNGRAERKGNPHDVTPFIDPNQRDENWQSYAGASLDTLMGNKPTEEQFSPPLESTEEPEAAVPAVPESNDDSPFKSVSELKIEIMELVRKKYDLKEEAEVKVKVIEDAELPFNDDLANLEAILAKLTEKYAA